MNQQPAVGPLWHPKKNSVPEKLTSPPSRWRSACASLSLAALTLVAVSATAQINWIDTDLGGPKTAGYTTDHGDGTFDIFGGGSDIWGNTSQCHYRYAWAYGTSWSITMQVQNFTGDDTWSKCELMVDWADPAKGPQGGDAFIANMLTQPSSTAPPDGGTGQNTWGVDQFRTTSGGSADWLQVGANPAPTFPNTWMRIVRNGSIFSIWDSTDGVNWTDYLDIDTSKTAVTGSGGTSFGTAWPELVAVGIAVTDHNDTTTLADATVANVSANFTGITPPTVVVPTLQPTNATAYVGGEASFSFATTNNAIPNTVQPTYQWYKNGNLMTNATGQTFTWLADASDNGAQIYCQATIPAPYNTVVSTTNSAKVTLTVANTGIVKIGGLKVEMFSGAASRTAVEGGNVTPASSMMFWQNWDNQGGYGNYYGQRVSGFFIPPTSDSYVFYDASDDDSDLYLSTDNTAENKRLIAQSTAWTNPDNWFQFDNNGAAGADPSPGRDWFQAESDTFVDPVSQTVPYGSGIPLVKGQMYYIEGVHYQGTGGDGFTVTYQTESQMAVPGWNEIFTNGVPSILNATNGNLACISTADTTPTWTLQPASTTFTLNLAGNLTAAAVSGGEFTPFYQWYSNNVAIAGATASSYGLTHWPASANGASFYCVATSVMSGLSSTSAAAVIQIASPVTENGWALIDYWYNSGEPALAQLETNGMGVAPVAIATPAFAGMLANNGPANYGNVMTTIFYPPTTGLYDFYVNSDDQSDLFVSTDGTAANRQLVAQEINYCGSLNWQGDEGNTTTPDVNKCSATWQTNGTAPWAGGLALQAGHGYYIELDHRQGGGGDNFEATFVMHGAATPVDGTPSALTGSLIGGISVPRCFNVTVTQSPANVTVDSAAYATFTAAGTTDSTLPVGDVNTTLGFANYLVFQWYKNTGGGWKAIPGATSSSLTYGPASAADNNDQFLCKIRALGYVDNSGTDLWQSTAAATLTVNSGQVLESGVALHEYWHLNPPLANIENGSAGAPDWSMSCPAMDSDIGNVEVADNFADALIGYFIPPTTGNYTFFADADDSANLYISQDNSFADMQLVAQQTSWTGALNWGGGGGTPRTDQFTGPTGASYPNGIPLVAGQKYAMEAVHGQGGGGTWFGVTYELNSDPNYPNAPASGTPSLIRGNQVAAFVPKCTYVNFTNQPLSQTLNSYSSATFSVQAGTDSTTAIGPETDWRQSFNNFLMYQWYRNGVAVPGANSASYTIANVLPDDNNVFCAVRALGFADSFGNPLWTNSQAATLTVLTNTSQLLYASYYANSNYVAFGGMVTNYVVLSFSTPMDPVALGNPLTYTIPGATVVTAVPSVDYAKVSLGVVGTLTFPLTVTVSSSLSGMGGGLPVTTPSIALNAASELTDVDIGSPPGSDPSVPGLMYPDGANAYTIVCEGSDQWNNADGFNFAYEMKTNDFDVVVRVTSITKVSNWSKAGLMVREDLTPASRNWNIVNDPSNSDGIEAVDGSGTGANAVESNTRISANGGSSSWNINPNPAPHYPNAWVRLARIGTQLFAYYSTNGTSWTLQATNDPTLVGDMTPLPSVVYVGISTSAHDNDSIGASPLKYLETAVYDNYNSAYVQTSKVNATLSAGQISITWLPASGTLQSGPTPNGPWTAVAGASGGSYSITLPTSNSNQFFRVAN